MPDKGYERAKKEVVLDLNLIRQESFSRRAAETSRTKTVTLVKRGKICAHIDLNLFATR